MGIHEFEYHLDNHFFEEIGGSEFQSGNVFVKLTLERTPHVFDLSFKIQGVIQVSCDRCLDDMDLPVNTRNRLYIKFGNDPSEETDEIIIVSEDEGMVDLSWYLYEFIALAIPTRHVHPQGKCNEQMATKLSQMLKGNDDDDSTSDTASTTTTDPRWDALKKLIDNN